MNHNGSTHIVRLADQQVFPLRERLTTIGSSKRSKIRIPDESIPQHCAYILFSQGSYYLYPIDTRDQVTCNGKNVNQPIELLHSSVIAFGKEAFLFENSSFIPENADGSLSFRKLIGALNAFFKNVNPDSRFEMLTSISQALRCDGARLVVEDQVNKTFLTIARYPQSSSLDRFSERALQWAKQERRTILMNSSEWIDGTNQAGSLELNNVGSILCMPIISNDVFIGYLYLDRFVSAAPFDKVDWEICDALMPIFGDILALYYRTIEQQKTISELINEKSISEKPLVYACDKMQKIIETTLQFAKTDTTVLLNGETGTGKEVFARLLHKNSNRAEGPFLVINCGAIPENLIESELFGHEKGAFTGATTRKAGLFEAAEGGTVFLDEIGELSMNLQVRLLRVLQESEVLPIGATTVLHINTRVITATNKNLLEEVEKKNFRMDLYYRLNILRIELPPLRERGSDMLLIANYFIKKYTKQLNSQVREMTLAAQSKILKHSWPGNIREMENIIQKAVIISKGTMIDESELDIDFTDSVCKDIDKKPFVSLKEARENAEKITIEQALSYCSGNVTMAANILQVDRKWLTKLIKEHGIIRII
jgi:Nif-specific regulatory protein